MSDEIPIRQSTVPPDFASESDWQARLRAQLGELDARARDLVNQGNQSRLQIQHNGRQIVDLPLTVVAALGAVAVLVSPLGVVAALAGAALVRVSARVERNE